MAHLWDGLPLDTPTLISDDGDVQIWATRTPTGGTVETRPLAGGPTATLIANIGTVQTRISAALAANANYLAIANPTNAQAVAQVGALTRQVDGLVRLLLGMFDTTAGT